MSNIVDIIKAKDKLICSGSVTSDTINKAEQELGLTFSDEYKEYVSRFGCVSFVGHELTGICTSESLNVVSSTNRCRQFATDVLNCWYVIEETNIDGIIIWQSPGGAVYQTQPNKEPEIIAECLSSYIESL